MAGGDPVITPRLPAAGESSCRQSQSGAGNVCYSMNPRVEPGPVRVLPARRRRRRNSVQLKLAVGQSFPGAQNLGKSTAATKGRICRSSTRSKEGALAARSRVRLSHLTSSGPVPDSRRLIKSAEKLIRPALGDAAAHRSRAVCHQPRDPQQNLDHQHSSAVPVDCVRRLA